MTWPAAGKTYLRSRQVHLNQVRNVNPGDVRPVVFHSRAAAAKDQQIDEFGQFRIFGILSEENTVLRRAGATVEVFVGQRDQALVKQRVALTRHLHPLALALVRVVPEYGHLAPAGGGINPDDLL